MLIWEPVKDRHTFGVSGNHRFCIRLNKENKVTGLYYLTDKTKKWVPSDEDEENLESMKLVAEFILEQKLAKKISYK